MKNLERQQDYLRGNRTVNKVYKSPLELCQELRLDPTDKQRLLFEAFSDHRSIDVSDTTDSIKAVGLCLLWGALSGYSINFNVLGPKHEREWVIAFITGLILRDPDMNERITKVTVRSIEFDTDSMIRAGVPVEASVDPQRGLSSFVLLGASKNWASKVEKRLDKEQDQLIRLF